MFKFFKKQAKKLKVEDWSSSASERNILKVGVGTNTIGLSTALLPNTTMLSIFASKVLISLLLLFSLRRNIHGREKISNSLLLLLCIAEATLAGFIYFTTNNCQINASDPSDYTDESQTDLCKGVIFLEVLYSLSSLTLWGTGEFNPDTNEGIMTNNLTQPPTLDEPLIENNRIQLDNVEQPGAIEIEMQEDPDSFESREEGEPLPNPVFTI